MAVCKFGQARYCRSLCGYGANYGKCPSKKETYFGYKLHAMVTLEGFIASFGITPASVNDGEGLRNIVSNCFDITVFGDKGYVGEVLAEELKEQGICLIPLKCSNSKNNWPKPVRQLIFRLRRGGGGKLFFPN